MTEKLLTSHLLPPQTLGMGSLGRNSTFFQYSIKTTQHHQRYLYRDTMRGSRNFLPRGGGGGRGGGSRLLNLFYSLKRGSNGFITHFLGGGSNFFQGGGPIENHITMTCDFQGGGSGPPSIPLWIRTWTLWYFGTNRLRRNCICLIKNL